MLSPDDPFELSDDPEAEVITEDDFFAVLGLRGCCEKYPLAEVIAVGGVLALEILGEVSAASGLELRCFLPRKGALPDVKER